jgi:hypothetical protein
VEPTKAFGPGTANEGEHVMKGCCRLLSDAIIDRLKRKEANSLITNFMLLLAFHFGIEELQSAEKNPDEEMRAAP